MAKNAKIREEIQNINSQLNTRARFQTPIPTSLPASCSLLQLLGHRLKRTSQIQWRAMEQSYQIGEGTPVLGLHSRDSHWIWAAQQSLTLTQLPLNRDEHKPTACLLTTNFCFWTIHSASCVMRPNDSFAEVVPDVSGPLISCPLDLR